MVSVLWFVQSFLWWSLILDQGRFLFRFCADGTPVFLVDHLCCDRKIFFVHFAICLLFLPALILWSSCVGASMLAKYVSSTNLATHQQLDSCKLCSFGFKECQICKLELLVIRQLLLSQNEHCFENKQQVHYWHWWIWIGLFPAKL